MKIFVYLKSYFFSLSFPNLYNFRFQFSSFHSFLQSVDCNYCTISSSYFSSVVTVAGTGTVFAMSIGFCFLYSLLFCLALCICKSSFDSDFDISFKSVLFDSKRFETPKDYWSMALAKELNAYCYIV